MNLKAFLNIRKMIFLCTIFFLMEVSIAGQENSWEVESEINLMTDKNKIIMSSEASITQGPTENPLLIVRHDTALDVFVVWGTPIKEYGEGLIRFGREAPESFMYTSSTDRSATFFIKPWPLIDKIQEMNPEDTITIQVNNQEGTPIIARWVVSDFISLFNDSIMAKVTGPAGGFIFYDKGSYSDGWRYLEAAPIGWFAAGRENDPRYSVNPETDISRWKDNSLYGITARDYPSIDIGSGDNNTKLLLRAINTGSYLQALRACDEYEVIVNSVLYDDWYMPSLKELELMYENLHLKGLGGFSDGNYWSSSLNVDRKTEDDIQIDCLIPLELSFQIFRSNYMIYGSSTSTPPSFYVRPVQSF